MTTYSTDPALYIFTSLTAGSSHIVTATSRLETILRANRIPFKAVDIATDEKARMLWGRRAGKDEGGRLRKLPGLVQEGLVLGDLVEIEDWNEYGELKQHVKIYYDEHTIPNIHSKPPEPAKPSKPAAKPAAASNTTVAPKAAPPMLEPKSGPEAATKAKHGPAESGKETTLPMRTVADEAAQKAKELNLKSLREKVHGTRVNDGSLESSSETAVADSKSRTEDGEKTTDIKEQKPPGLQSPTSTSWKNKSGEDALRETVQSPTSGRWRPNSVDATGVKTHNGARVVAASPEEIKQIEREQKIKEEPELEGGDEEKDKAAKKGKDDLKDGAKKDASKENEDEDNEDDEEENDKGRKRSEKAEKSVK